MADDQRASAKCYGSMQLLWRGHLRPRWPGYYHEDSDGLNRDACLSWGGNRLVVCHGRFIAILYTTGEGFRERVMERALLRNTPPDGKPEAALKASCKAQTAFYSRLPHVLHDEVFNFLSPIRVKDWMLQFVHEPFGRRYRRIHDVSVSENGNAYAVLDSIGRVMLYKMKEQTKSMIHQDPAFQDPQGNRESAYAAIDLSPNGMLVAICSPGFVRVFDVKSRTQVWHASLHVAGTPEDVASIINDVSFSPNGKLLASCGVHGSVHVFNAFTGEVLLSHEPGTRGEQGGKLPIGPEFKHPVRSVSFSPDGRRLALIKEDNDVNEKSYVEMFDLQTAQALWHSRKVRGFLRVAFSPNGRSVAAPCGLEMLVFNALSGAEIASAEIRPVPGLRMTHVSYSPDGSCVAATYNDGDIAIFRMPYAPGAGAQIAREGEGGGGGGGGAGFALQKLHSLNISFS